MYHKLCAEIIEWYQEVCFRKIAIHDEMDWACRMHGVFPKCIQKLYLEIVKGNDNLENPGVNERVIFKRILRVKLRKVWTGLVQYED
jgi:hypothetical protein